MKRQLMCEWCGEVETKQKRTRFCSVSCRKKWMRENMERFTVARSEAAKKWHRTVPQRILLEAVGDGWEPEVVYRTGMPRTNEGRYPSHYKIDLANKDAMIAVEVDGGSHGTRLAQARDRKKDAFLRSCGWKVLRFRNERILNDLESVLRGILSGSSI